MKLCLVYSQAERVIGGSLYREAVAVFEGQAEAFAAESLLDSVLADTMVYFEVFINSGRSTYS
jgi:hypothetical protein